MTGLYEFGGMTVNTSTIINLLTAIATVVATIIASLSYFQSYGAKQNSPQSLREGQKLCSVATVSPGNTWRDSFVAPRNWKPKQCFDYARQAQADFVTLMCMYEDEISVGYYGGKPDNPGMPLASFPNIDFPEIDCGWKKSHNL